MKQNIKFDRMNRVLSVVLVFMMIVSVIPVGVFAVSSPAEITTDIESKNFVVGTATEFTFTTKANDDAGRMVVGFSDFDDKDAIASLEYFEVRDGNWYKLDGEFGPKDGFRMSDATSKFRVTFRTAGNYSFKAYMKDAETGEIVCSTEANLTVHGSSVFSTDIGEKEFAVGVSTEFTFKTVANGDKDVPVKGYAEFSDPKAIAKLEYYEIQDGKWYEFAGEFGPEGGFPMSDAESRFRVTFNKAGIFTVNAHMKRASDGFILCSTEALAKVSRSDCSISTNIGDIVFVENAEEAQEFTFSTTADASIAGTIMVKGSATFSDKSAIETLEYYEIQDGNWYKLDGEFGGSEGFSLMNLSSTFRVKFNKAGVYTVKAQIIDTEGNVLCVCVATAVVKKDSPISYEKDVEMLFTDVNKVNDTLVNAVEGAEFTYKSNDTNVVNVSETGVLTPVGAGTTTITVTRKATEDYIESTTEYTVTVKSVEYGEIKWTSSVPDSVTWTKDLTFTNTVVSDERYGKVTYSSNNTDVAEVDPASGVVTVKKPGTVIITASITDNKNYNDATSSYTLVIDKADQNAIAFENANPDSVSFGDTFKNAASGGSVDNANIKYSIETLSGDKPVAAVNADGSLNIFMAGTVKVTATLAGNEYYNDAAPVSYVLTIDLGVNTEKLTFTKGDALQTIVYGTTDFANPATFAGDAVITYSSSDEKIAKVTANGVIETLKAGEVEITASVPADDKHQGQTITYKLVITHAPQTVILATPKDKIPAITYNDAKYNNIFANAATATTENIVYESSDKEVATVDATGKVTILKAGTVTITATATQTEQYAEASESYTLTINKADQTIEFANGREHKVTFNDNENKYENSAKSDAVEAGEADIVPVYSVISGSEFIVDGTFDSTTGNFVIKGAGTVVVGVKFNANGRYNEKEVQYTLTVEKDDQVIFFDNAEVTLDNGDNSFTAPVALSKGELFGIGEITYVVKEDKNGVVKTFENNFFTFTGNVGSVVIVATKAACENYNETTAEYTLVVKDYKLDTEKEYFAAIGETIATPEWFTGNVSVKAAEGYVLSFERTTDKAEWLNTLADVVTVDTTGTSVSFYVKEVETGKISDLQTVEIKRDTVAPMASLYAREYTAWEKFLTIITFNLWKPDDRFYITSDDATSKDLKVEYYIDYGTTAVKSEDEIKASAWEWKTYTDDGIPVEENTIFVIYAKVTDKAGQYLYAKTNGIVFDGTPVAEENIKIDVLTPVYKGLGNSTAEFYHGDIEVLVSAEDAKPSSGIKSISYEVFCGTKRTSTQSGTVFSFDTNNKDFGDKGPGYDKLVSKFEATDKEKIVIDAAKNNNDNVYLVITVVDNAGNETKKEFKFSICTENLEISSEFTVDPKRVHNYGGVDFYNQNRVLELTITGRGSVIEASNIGKPVVNASKEGTYVITDWKFIENNENPDKSQYVCIISFNGSATYTYEFKGQDVFGKVLSDTTDKFAVDHDKPTATVVVDEKNTWTTLLETLTFGLWKNTSVEIDIIPNDATSPIRDIAYYFYDGTVALEREDLNALEADKWIPYNGSFMAPMNQRVTVYFKVTDYANQSEYFSSDGHVIEDKKGNITLTPDAANENGYYKEDFSVEINVKDEEISSGIKKVEYWVENNGKETIRETLYSFDFTRNTEGDKSLGKLVISEYGKEDVIKENTALSYDDLTKEFNTTVTVNAKENNSDNVVVYVKVTDNAGNEWPLAKTDVLKVDATAPKIYVEFNSVANPKHVFGEKGYFSAYREAFIKITERETGFDVDRALESIKITAVDVNDKSDGIEMPKVEFDGTEKNEENPDEAIHKIKVTFAADANYDFTLSYRDNAGNVCEYEDVAFKEGHDVAARYFAVDTTAPTGTVKVDRYTWNMLLETLTFGLWKSDKVEVNVDPADKTSPVFVEYFKTDDVSIKGENALDNADFEKWNGLSIENDEKFTVYFKITDYAGNYLYISSDGFVVDKTMPVIEFSIPEADYTHDGVPGFTKDVDVLVKVNEIFDGIGSGLKKVSYKVVVDNAEKPTQEETLYEFKYARTEGLNSNGGTYQVYENGVWSEMKTGDAPKYDDLKHSFNKTIKIDSKLNNSCGVVVYVYAMDNAGNWYEERLELDFDIDAPEITVTYDNNDAYKVVDGKGYFPATRKATVVIKERDEHFDPENATKGITITAVDVNRKNVVENCASLISGWTKSGKGNDATHTATIDYSADANYTFAIEYTDLAKRKNAPVDTKDSAAPYEFAVDNNKPTGTVSAGKYGTWEKLVETLTFGLWSKESVEITGTSNDVTTPIESVSYFKTSSNSYHSEKKLDALSEESWTAFDKLTIPKDEKFVVYIRVVDSAGNTTYISTDGIIVDETIPDIQSVKPEITITPDPSNGVYNSNVTFAVTVVDPMVGETNAYAGLKEIRYEVYSLNNKTQEGVLYRFDTATSDVLQKWSRKDAIVVDKNKNNSNEVTVKVYAVDNAGNEGYAEHSIKIDITKPKIEVSYDNNVCDKDFAGFFKANRTATIKITERNFDPNMVKLTVTSAHGSVPVISGWEKTAGTAKNGDDTVYTATVTFSEDDDYTFDISCEDTATNANEEVKYGTSVAPKQFTLDKKAPKVTITFTDKGAKNGNYFADYRTLKIQVEEHNFETSRVKLDLVTSNFTANDTKKLEESEWENKGGDIYEKTIVFCLDNAKFTFDFDYTDKAGNSSADYEKQEFFVDKIAPTLEISGIANNSANNDKGNIGFVIKADDTNFSEFTPVITAVIKNGDKFEQKQMSVGKFSEDKKTFTVENLEADGVYRITCTVIDKAGNKFTEVVRSITGDKTEVYKIPENKKDNPETEVLTMFSVNRDGSAFEITDANTLDVIDRYFIQKLTGDLVITEINADELVEYSVILNGKALEENTAYTITMEKVNDSWVKYTYVIKKDIFYNEDGTPKESEYSLEIQSKDKATNDANSDAEKVSVKFEIDCSAPTVAISGLDENGRYQTENQKVTIRPEDFGELNTLVVRLVDDDGNVIRDLVNLSGEALAEAIENNDGNIVFEIGSGLYQNVQIICTDKSTGDGEGTNTYEKTIKNVSVSSSGFMIFWANKALRWGTIGGISALIIGVVVFIVLKNKKRKDDK